MQRQNLAPFRSAAQYTRWVESQGLTLADRRGFRRAVGTDSDYFRITSTGYVGNSARKVESIIHLRRVPHELLYWRED